MEQDDSVQRNANKHLLDYMIIHVDVSIVGKNSKTDEH